MQITRTRSFFLAAAVAAVLPLAGDQAMDPTCNATTSLASGVTDPVNGDFEFFKTINPGSNVMLIIDNSGSMATMADCDTGGWGSGGCTVPSISAPAAPASNTTGTVLVNGTCLPATGSGNSTYTVGTVAFTNTLAWMEAVVPSQTYVDPGHGGAATDDMFDCPAWGSGPGCATTCDAGGTAPTDNCLFDPNAYYKPSLFSYGGTWSSGGATSAARLKSGTSVLVATDTKAPIFDSSFNGPKLLPGATTLLDLGTAAQNCMKDKGFFIFNARFPDGQSGSNYTYGSNSTTGTVTLFRGTFLNGSPPKAVAARKVLKDVLWMGATSSPDPNFDKVRFGLAWFNDTTKGKLISPLVPTLSVLNATWSRSDYRKARQPMIAFINNSANNFCGIGGTPSGRTLLNVGQYFAQQADASTTGYFPYKTGKTDWTTGSTNCNGGCSNSGFTFTPATDNENCAVCFPACQKNTAIFITDGVPNENETTSNFPNDVLSNTDINTAYATYCPNSCDSNGNKGTGSGFTHTCCPDNSGNASMAPKVAKWLRTYNLWPTKSSGSPVTLTTYAIGFNVPGGAANVLNAIGKMGGGDSFNATNFATLATALNTFVTSASMLETSFAAPSVDTLQTSQSASSDAFLTRFIPNTTNTWEGHVFQAGLFDEFANGCDPTKPYATQSQVCCNPGNLAASGTTCAGSPCGGTCVNPYLDGASSTGNAVCNKVFLIDNTCKAIGEDSVKGGFYQLDNSGGLTGTSASLTWDAGQVLSNRTASIGKGYRSACQDDGNAPCRSTLDKPRNIFTWLPDGSGVMRKVSFTTANVATLQPYLSIDPAWCTALLNTILWTPLPTTAADKLTTCAKQIIYFVRGFDIFNKNLTSCRGPGHPANGTGSINPACFTSPTGAACTDNPLPCKTASADYGAERNRDTDRRSPAISWKLGDIFHSTPVTVHVPANVVTCDLGYDGQCLATIHSPSSLPYQTKMQTGYAAGTAWDQYRTDNTSRKRVVMVGANDGMLHAFDAGTPTGTADALGNRPYSDGTGEELWAFIPPDLLPKLWRLVRDGNQDDHQYMVDGPSMVREVWVDGSNQTDATLGTKDGTKQNQEFHAVAVLSERTGGTNFTALDVTDPTTPKVLWTFPRPASPESKYMGLSWTDFTGRPPPIGPVRIKLPASAIPGQDPTSRGWEERWVVMLNGGYDPTLNRGRAVFMVDAWTGATLWSLTDDDLKTGGKNALGFGSGTSMFPVTGAVALVDLGDPSKPAFDTDGFFDTATWGDLGGNLWVARFNDPGELGTDGKVGNWFAARTFEQGRVSGNAQSAKTRQPFFAMTSNAYEATTRTLRTYQGSGNREQLTRGAVDCREDNLIGCCQAGCTVSATTSQNYGGTCGWSSTFSCDSSGNMSHAAVTDSPSACGASVSCAGTSTFQAAASVTVTSCPGGITGSGTLSCDSSGTCSSTASTPAFTQLGTASVSPTGTAPVSPRFFGVWSYGKDAAKTFNTLAQAVTFDANRFTDNAAYTGTCASGSCTLIDTTTATVSYNPTTNAVTATTGNKASAADPGWFYTYQGSNEKTGAGSTVVLGCTAWNGFMSTASGPNICTGSGGKNTSVAYLSDYITGIPTPTCGYGDGTSLIGRSASQTTTAPPTTSTVRVVVNAAGQVEYSALQLNPGAGPAVKAVGTRKTVLEPVYWLEVPRALHNCRHDATLSASTCE